MLKTYDDDNTYYISAMVLILDGNSGMVAQGRSNLYYLICLRHFIISRGATSRLFFLRKDIYFFMRAQHIMSYHLINLPMVSWVVVQVVVVLGLGVVAQSTVFLQTND